jgi:PRC-barrel domain
MVLAYQKLTRSVSRGSWEGETRHNEIQEHSAMAAVLIAVPRRSLCRGAPFLSKEIVMSSTMRRSRPVSTSTDPTNLGLAVNETERLIASDKVEGTAVYDQAGTKLGSVHTLMIDKYTGQVDYAVLSFGGFLGIGAQYHPLPWQKLTYDASLGGYVVDLTRAQLERAPHFALDEEPWTDPGYGQSVYDYYGLPYER